MKCEEHAANAEKLSESATSFTAIQRHCQKLTWAQKDLEMAEAEL